MVQEGAKVYVTPHPLNIIIVGVCDYKGGRAASVAGDNNGSIHETISAPLLILGLVYGEHAAPAALFTYD